MKQLFNKFHGLIIQHKILAALCLVFIISGVLTAVSMTLYIQSGASGLDLSRPGFMDSRDNLQQEIDTTFKSTGELTLDDVATFKRLYDRQRAVLNSLSSFDDDVISDDALGLTVVEQLDETETAQ